MTRLARRACLLTLVAAVAIALVSTGFGECPDDRVSWLEDHAIPLDACVAESGFEDLAPLAAMIGDAQIVGLGESTHGTREHFQMKHRLVEYLVEELGFSWFAIEASTPEAHRLDAYVLGGDGDPEELIRGMYFWTWTTKEVLAMVEWMRAYNAQSDHKIHFTGFDMQYNDVAIGEVVRFLREVESPLAERAPAHYLRVAQAYSGPSFATATYTIDPTLAHGKTIRFTAWIRTKDVHSGFAGLWCRIDGGDGKVLALENMVGRGLTGTTEWTECEIEVAVDENAQKIYFGFMLTGQGDAWFDEARMSVDGADLDTSELDLGFEGTKIIGWHTNLGHYSSWLDRWAAYNGAQSLRLSGAWRDPSIPMAVEALPEAEAFLAELESSREEWLDAYPSEVVERMLLNARIIAQDLRSKAGVPGGTRDAAMADNVAWLAEHHPGERIVLWAHNAHISRMPGMMGAYLAEQIGEGYLPIGFATAAGEYYAIGEGGLGAHELQEPPADSFEACFRAATAPDFILDLREADAGDPGSMWLTETRSFRGIGSMAWDEQFSDTPLSDYYDLIVFIEETTAARQL